MFELIENLEGGAALNYVIFVLNFPVRNPYFSEIICYKS